MKLILACCLILISVPSFSQIQTDSINPKAIIMIRLQKDTTELAYKINISRLTIVDSRDDTSSLGYSVSLLGGAKNYVFQSGFENELTDWFSNYLMINEQNKTGTTLLVNIKKLRLSNEITPKIYENGHVGQPNEGWEKGAIIKIEYYLKKDSFYFPLYRFDSIITLKENLRRNADDYVSTALKLSLAKIFTINLDIVGLSKNKIIYNDILRVNRQTYDLPVYTCVFNKKGVYKTFSEFKMNDPSLLEFEFRKGKMGDILYITENGSEYSARKVWGYCNGKNFFINSGDKYSKLIRSGYSFYFEGIKAVTRKQGYTSNSSLFNPPGLNSPMLNTMSSVTNNTSVPNQSETKFKKEIRYYQVDMETGKVY